MTEPGTSSAKWTAQSRPLLAGTAEGTGLVLEQPLSLWGGLEPESGTVIETRHPQRGRSIAGRVLVMPSGRGSSSSSSVLAEALRAGSGPVAIVLQDADEIVLVGALVIQMLDQHTVPIVQVDDETYRRIDEGAYMAIAHDGMLTVTPVAG